MAQMPLSSSRLSPDLAAFVDGWAYSELIFFVVALFVCFGLRPQSLHLEHHKWDCCVVCVCVCVLVYDCVLTPSMSSITSGAVVLCLCVCVCVCVCVCMNE